MLSNLERVLDKKAASLVREVFDWIENGARSKLDGEPDLTDPLTFRPLAPRAELAFLKRSLEFLDEGFYFGGWEGLHERFENELILFLKSFAIPRADKPDQPRLIIDGGTKMRK